MKGTTISGPTQDEKRVRVSKLWSRQTMAALTGKMHRLEY